MIAQFAVVFAVVTFIGAFVAAESIVRRGRRQEAARVRGVRRPASRRSRAGLPVQRNHVEVRGQQLETPQ